MTTLPLIETPDQVKLFKKQALDKADHESNPTPKNILFVHPRCFRIEHPINVHMLDDLGNPHAVDTHLAEGQWQALVEVYTKLGLNCHVINVDSMLPDMVFCANQTFPFQKTDGSKHVLLSEMMSEFRKPEVPYFEAFFKDKGFNILSYSENKNTPVPEDFHFEGMGDLLPAVGSALIFGGCGPRTSHAALEWISKQTEKQVMKIELPNPKFYHLDTCLSILSDSTAAACKAGFTETGWELLNQYFDTLIEIDLDEADAPGFAGNCHSPDGKNIVIQQGNAKAVAAFIKNGFQVHEVETGEYIKAGGSVFCMKMMFP